VIAALYAALDASAQAEGRKPMRTAIQQRGYGAILSVSKQQDRIVKQNTTDQIILQLS